MRRVMVVGQPGSGQSTLARALSAHGDLPVVHLDRLHWAPCRAVRLASDRPAAAVLDALASDRLGGAPPS